MRIIVLLSLITLSLSASSFIKLNGEFTKLKKTKKYVTIQTSLSLDDIKSSIDDIDEIKKINSNSYVIKFNSEQNITNNENFTIISSFNRDKEWPVILSDRVIIKTKKTTSKSALYNVLSKNGLKIAETILPNVHVILVNSKNSLNIANDLFDSDLFEYSYPDFYIYHVRKFVPNDTYYSQYQWHLNTAAGVNAEQAWDITRGSASIKIAIVDDGMTIYHEDLDLINYRDFSTNQNDFDDGGNHGTSCAGVAAAKGNNNQGVTGLCMNCKLIAAKMMRDSGYSLSSADARAIKWVVDQGADVLNNSWGYEENFNIHIANPSLVDAINYATRHGRDGKGAVVLFASGNENRRFSNDSLEGLENIITVGASTDSEERSSYSNYGEHLDVVAPSNGGRRGITTTDAYSRRGEDERGYNIGAYTATFGGTSSATPLVSGLVGLILSENSNLTYIQVREVLINSTKKIGSGYRNGHSDYYGYGKVDAKKALDYVRNMNGSNPCRNTNCQTNAYCIVENSIAICKCETGFNLVGSNCVAETVDVCEGVNCPLNSHCAENNNEASCYCDTGFKVNAAGTACESEITDLCAEVNCPSNSHCEANNNKTACYCDEGFEVNSEATACVEIYVDPCETKECSSNSTCITSEDKESASCSCNDGYEMKNNKCVVIVIDPCETTNCPNNSYCQANKDKASCYCNDGFKVNSKKTACVSEYSVCDGINCPSNSHCEANNSNNAACYCNDGYGVNDERTACVQNSINPCSNINCGYGSCNSYEGVAYCNCNQGYHPDNTTGLTCVINNINTLCEGITCSSNGNCNIVNNNPTCECNSGYQSKNLNCIQGNSISQTDIDSDSIVACNYSKKSNNLPILLFLSILSLLFIRKKYQS